MSIVTKNISVPDSDANLPDGSSVKHMEFDSTTVSVISCKPGWMWSKHVKPKVCTNSSEKDHMGYLFSGRLACQMTGEEAVVELGPGDAFRIPPGHDAWVVGDNEVVMEFTAKEVIPYALKE